MLRILVLCARDWQHPRATGVERYVYEVFRRVAAEGNYVVWLCQNHGGIPFMRPRAQTLQQVDGIQLARLGAKALYRAMTGLFFSRMAGSDGVLRQFDVVVDCVTGRPFPVSKYTATPLIPIVFRLSPGLQEPLGPIIAPTEQACSDLRNAGVPRGHVIRAPFGCAECPLPFPVATTETPSITGFVESAQPFSHAMRRLSVRFERPVEGTVAGPARGLMPHVRQLNAVSAVELPLAQVSGAWAAYCGEGCEWRALDFADAGIPVVCPDTPLGREFVKAGDTGLLHRARDSAHLADVLESLLRDETLRRRLANEAKSRVHDATWDRSASLLLAALENLCYTGKELLSPVPSL